MNSENSETSEPHVLLLKLTDKLDLRRGEKSIDYTWENIENSYNNNKFKISVSTWNGRFELPDGSYSYSLFSVFSFKYIYSIFPPVSTPSQPFSLFYLIELCNMCLCCIFLSLLWLSVCKIFFIYFFHLSCPTAIN